MTNWKVPEWWNYPTRTLLPWHGPPCKPPATWTRCWGWSWRRSWEKFRSAAALFDMAPLSVVYADADGNIGYQATGLIPIRGAGDGHYPAPGWESEYDWQDFWPFESLPWSFNPASGVVVAANQPLARPDLIRHIGSDFDYGYRARRIHELLAGALPPDTAGMSAMQFDHQSPSASFLVPALAAVTSGPSLAGRGVWWEVIGVLTWGFVLLGAGSVGFCRGDIGLVVSGGGC